MWIVLGIVVLLAVICIGLAVYERRDKCCKCGKPVWVRFANATPTGPNPLNIRLRYTIYHCNSCGHYSHTSD